MRWEMDRWVDREGRGVLWLGRWIGRDPDVEWRRPKGNDGTMLLKFRVRGLFIGRVSLGAT